ncbi:MAG: hypothetical protein V3U39_07410 [Acidimicrobiia bacterium]
MTVPVEQSDGNGVFGRWMFAYAGAMWEPRCAAYASTLWSKRDPASSSSPGTSLGSKTPAFTAACAAAEHRYFSVRFDSRSEYGHRPPGPNGNVFVLLHEESTLQSSSTLPAARYSPSPTKGAELFPATGLQDSAQTYVMTASCPIAEHLTR